MLLNKIIEFTYHNPIDKIAEENEDALEIKTDNSLQLKQIAISDGAGGAGIYCKEWANFIVKNAPSLEEAKVNINNWLVETSKEFYFEYKDQVSEDSLTREKFLSIGSYATFLFLWIDLKNKTLFYTGVGDSSVFVLRKTEERYVPVLIFPLDKNEFIDQNPQLINWKKKRLSE
ncbi:MAG: PP2C family serine/threonine-protein phosphatase, partial [Flavobacterium sp.]